MTPSLTIIIPVYGVAEYLRGCLESVIDQTVSGYSVILVDDGSVDGSGDICDEYAARDKRIKVIHQPNGGRSRARNAGLDACETDWIWFVDGDDAIQPDSVEKLLGAAEKGSEMVLFDNTGRQFEPRELTAHEIGQYILIMLNSEKRGLDPKCHFMLSCMEGPITCKLFKRDFLESNCIRFDPELVCSQDYIFMLRALLKLRKASVIGGRFYEYNINENSISFKYNEKIPGMYALLCAETKKLLEGMPREYIDRYYLFVFFKLKGAIRLYFGRSDNPKPYEQLKREFCEYVKDPVVSDALRSYNRRLAGFKLCVFALLCRTGSIKLIKRTHPNLCDI